MRTGVVVAVGLISAGLVIGGTVWYFNSRPKKSSDADDKSDKGEDIPDTTKTVSSSTSNETQQSSPTKTKSTSVSSGGSASAATSSNSIDEAKSKFGSGARVKDNQLFAPFNSNKNIAIFYSNGRFAIFKIGEEKKGTLLKGSYKNGGLTLIPDKGKEITSGSAWTNLNRLPFKK